MVIRARHKERTCLMVQVDVKAGDRLSSCVFDESNKRGLVAGQAG